MKLSIIIVNWNTVELTTQAFDAVFKETTGFEYEVILVDNHSSDNSVEVIKKKFPQVRLIENSENRGFGKANNQAMQIAQGDYIFLLNSDTIILDHAINRLVSYLDQHPDVMCVGPRLLNKDLTFQHACRRNLPNPENAFFHLFGLAKIFTKSKTVTAYKKFTDDPLITEPVEAISGAAMMFRREVFETIGGFDEMFFMYAEDLDLCKRIKDKGWKTVYVSDARIIHLGGASSGKRRKASLINFYEAMWMYYQKHFAPTRSSFFNFFIWLGIKIKLRVALFLNTFKR